MVSPNFLCVNVAPGLKELHHLGSIHLCRSPLAEVIPPTVIEVDEGLPHDDLPLLQPTLLS
jgi:hypothetical protein